MISRDILPPIDLTWEVTSSQRLAQATGWRVQSVWQESLPATICGCSVKVLSPEDTVVYLNYHIAFRHLFKGSLRWYIDLVKIIDKGHLDWDKILAKAKFYGLTAAMYKVLVFVRKVLGANIPSEVLSQLNRVSLARFVTNRLWDSSIDKTLLNQPAGFKYLFLQSLLLDKPRQIVRAISYPVIRRIRKG